ncbi:MAG: methyltransferase domain-containing protein, partial [Brevundimonas sp.]
MSPSSGPPVIFDSQRRTARLERSEKSFASADFLHARAAQNAVDSLDALLRDWPEVADLSAHSGSFAAALAESPAAARAGAVKTIGDRAARAGPGNTPLDLPDQSQDLVVSLMSLHWANDLPGALSQIRKAMKPDGLFVGTLLGAGTLKELRTVLTEAELEQRGGAQARVSPFADGYDGAALLQRAGFALPVSDVDRLTVRYPDLLALIRDLRAMGETNVLAGNGRP